MTPETSIEILEEMHSYAKHKDLQDDLEALRLGIEALELNKTMRETYAHPELLVLPSETAKVCDGT